MTAFHVIFLLLCCFICYCTCSSDYADFDIRDEFIPEQCDQIATAGDHLLIEYDIVFANGTKGAALKEPSQLYHILLDLSVRLVSICPRILLPYHCIIT